MSNFFGRIVVECGRTNAYNDEQSCISTYIKLGQKYLGKHLESLENGAPGRTRTGTPVLTKLRILSPRTEFSTYSEGLGFLEDTIIFGRLVVECHRALARIKVQRRTLQKIKFITENITDFSRGKSWRSVLQIRTNGNGNGFPS